MEEEEVEEEESVVNGVGGKEEGGGGVMRRDGGVWASDNRGGSDSCAASFATYNSGAFYSSSEANNESLVMGGFYNNDSSGTYYCDSDSGVSSMYESIQRSGNHGDASSGTTNLIRRLSFSIFSETYRYLLGGGIIDCLDTQHLDPTLQVSTVPQLLLATLVVLHFTLVRSVKVSNGRSFKACELVM